MRGKLWHARIALVVLGVGMAASAQPSRADAISISGDSTSLDIRIAEAQPCRFAVSALAAAVGAELLGDCGREMIAPNHLRGTSLHAALATLLPHRPFVIMLKGEPPKPTAILFPVAITKKPGKSTVSMANAAEVPLAYPQLPAVNRADYIKHLPMLKTH